MTTRNREFFGRTYFSRPMQLDDRFLNTAQKAREFIFMHTATKTTSTCMAIECFLEIVDFDKNEETHNVSIGFALYKMFGSGKGQAGPTQLPMYLGSPRLLIMKAPFKDLTTFPCRLTAQIKEYDIFNKIKHLLPSNTLCGMNDVILGIQGNILSLKRDGLKLCPKEDWIIDDISIQANTDFEVKFKNFLYEFIHEKYKTPKEISPKETMERIGRPMIKERRISIDYDNSWKSSGNKIFTSLNPQLTDGTYKAVGYWRWCCIAADAALTFKLEFRLEMPTEKSK